MGAAAALYLGIVRESLFGDDPEAHAIVTGPEGHALRTGEVVMMKQYVGRHRVLYRGAPDGEGCIQGTWSIGDNWTGPFLMRPVIGRPRGDEPIQDVI